MKRKNNKQEEQAGKETEEILNIPIFGHLIDKEEEDIQILARTMVATTMRG